MLKHYNIKTQTFIYNVQQLQRHHIYLCGQNKKLGSKLPDQTKV